MVAAKKRKRPRPVSNPKRKPKRPSYAATLRALLTEAYIERNTALAAAKAFEQEAAQAKEETWRWRNFDQYDLPTVRRQRDECYARIAELAKMVDETTAAEADAADRASRWERVVSLVHAKASDAIGVLDIVEWIKDALKAEGLDKDAQP